MSLIHNTSAFFRSVAFATKLKKSFVLRIKHLRLILTHVIK